MKVNKAHLAKSEEIDELPLACSSEAAAVAYLESKRWGNFPCCPRCGSVSVYTMKDAKTGERNRRHLWRCRDCKRQYSVRTGTVFEESLLPLRMWCRAYWEAASCKNGVSALELSRKLQISHKSALFVLNRLRWAMAETRPNPPKMEGVVEADEVWLGGRVRYPNGVSKFGMNKPKPKPKIPVMAVVQRGGAIRTRILAEVNAQNVSDILRENVDPSATLMTDAGSWYIKIGRPFADHGVVRHHRGEYVRPDNPEVHSNTAESYFARVRRALDGTWIAVSREHLPRYLAHVAFAMETSKMTDGERVCELIRRSDGKRLRYRAPESDRAAG